MKRLTFLIFLLPLAVHAGAGQTYYCDNGSQLDISMSADSDGRPQATLHFADGAIHLPQVPSPVGSRYRSEPVSLSLHEDRAIFEDGKGNRRECSSQPPAVSSFIEISGQVRYPGQLPPQARLIVLTQALGRPGSKALTLGEQHYLLNGAPSPISFSSTVDRDLLGKTARLAVSARIDIAGKTRYRSAVVYPAINHGQAAAVELELLPVGRK